MPAIPVVGGARPFRRDHRRTQRILGRTAKPECWAVCRLAESLQDLGADALGRLLGGYQVKVKDAVRIIGRVFFPQPQSTVRDHPDPAPFLISDFEYLAYYLLRQPVSLIAHGAHVLVLQPGLARLELLH